MKTIDSLPSKTSTSKKPSRNKNREMRAKRKQVKNRVKDSSPGQARLATLAFNPLKLSCEEPEAFFARKCFDN